MKFLQIRDDRPLSEYKKKCIRQLENILLPGDTLEVINIPRFDSIVETVNESDRVRTLWLLKNPFGVYIDDDCFLKYRFVPPNDGLIRLPRYRKGVDLPDIFLIYRNGSDFWFKRNFDLNKRALIINQTTTERMKPFFYGWPESMMREWKGFEYLPEDLYEHAGESMKQETERRKTMNGQGAPHINDVSADLVEKLTIVSAEIIKIKNMMNDIGERYNQVLGENFKLKSDFAAMIEKTSAKKAADPIPATVPKIKKPRKSKVLAIESNQEKETESKNASLDI